MQRHDKSRHSVAVPDDLESPRAKLIYLYIGAVGGTTTEALCADLELKKGTALSIIGTLRNRGHLERTESGYQLT
ncbi:MarR family transcriptional regulator [Natronorubrum daqingense]|uniref:MarR family transcriptional regulator n=1 Tax=Natronorubrum daqingense TaxID=588898 RepID=A0A1N6Z6X6_9EURY|nr:MarR family transcriptional regulator [Natronorubrum daqingense]APX95441.1 MarR family transcriptional regulator [Natronorubrum daqingense]SIR22555.1 hypothetical protein SAMN05421809_0701 [Natronorubrum daqingense]